MFEFDYDGTVARIVLARESRRNAIPADGWQELERILKAANMSPAHVVTISSSDPDSFCAGADMFELCGIAADPRRRRRFVGSMESAFATIRRVNKPTVALISGGCYGVGVALATACDVRVARPDADFALTPARFGMAYPQADVDSLVRLLGPGQAAGLLFCGRHVDGGEARRLGLVEFVDDGPDLGSELVASIAACDPRSLQDIKAALQQRWGTKERFVSSIGGADYQDFGRP